MLENLEHFLSEQLKTAWFDFGNSAKLFLQKLCFVQEETLKDLQVLATVLSWADALRVWKLNGTRRKKRVKTENSSKKSSSNDAAPEAATAEPEQEEQDQTAPTTETQTETVTETETVTPDVESSSQDSVEAAPKTKVTRFRVTCSRVGNNHSFSSNDAARDFGGAVQELFQWKADMTNFDIEVGVVPQIVVE